MVSHDFQLIQNGVSLGINSRNIGGRMVELKLNIIKMKRYSNGSNSCYSDSYSSGCLDVYAIVLTKSLRRVGDEVFSFSYLFLANNFPCVSL